MIILIGVLSTFILIILAEVFVRRSHGGVSGRSSIVGIVLLISIILVFIAAIIYKTEFVYNLPAGEQYAPKEPVQINLPANKQKPFTYDMNPEIVLTPLAEYDITGKVLSRKDHRRGNYTNSYEDTFFLMDIGLGWKEFSDTFYAMHDSIKFDNRFTYLHTKWERDFPYYGQYKEKVSPYISNNHIIPANNKVKRAVLKAGVGQIVRLQGFLVSFQHKNKPWYKGSSSMSRTDLTNKAVTNTTCEIFYVTDVEVTEKGSLF
jgi:hypothetical protein